ncbi:MAG TPA: hypothetical protein VM555_03990, partial [Tahibacter sp.]|nr:hypothetical protein [Tahibacter sp.]
MRSTVLRAALCAALAGAISGQAIAQTETDVATRTAAAQRLGFDQVGLDRDGRQNALLTNYGNDGTPRAAKAGATVLRAHGSDEIAALFHGELGALVGMLPGSTMAVRNVKTLADGTTYYNLTQTYQGVPVVGDEVTVQVG